MRRRILPFDIWLCLLLAFLVSLGTGAAETIIFPQARFFPLDVSSMRI